MSKHKKRLSDYARVRGFGDGLKVETRAKTGRGHCFGDAQVVNLRDDEAKRLYQWLDDHYGGDDSDD